MRWAATLLLMALAGPQLASARPPPIVDSINPDPSTTPGAGSAPPAANGPVAPPRRRTAPPDTGRWAPGPVTAPAKVEHQEIDAKALVDEALNEDPGFFWALQAGYVQRTVGSERYRGGGARAGLKLRVEFGDGGTGILMPSLGLNVYQDGLVEIPALLQLRWHFLLFYVGVGGGWVTFGGEGPNDNQGFAWVGHPVVQAEAGLNWVGTWELGVRIDNEFRSYKDDGDGGVHFSLFVGVDF